MKPIIIALAAACIISGAILTDDDMIIKAAVAGETVFFLIWFALTFIHEIGRSRW